MRCPYCGSTRLYLDEAQGMLVCMDCGSVVEEGVPDLSGGVVRTPEAVERRVSPRGPPASGSSRVLRLAERISGVGEDLRVVGELVSILPEARLDEILRVYREVGRLLPRRSLRVKLAAVHALIEYRRGRYPSISVIASLYRVSPESVKKAFRRLVALVEAARV